MLVTAEMRTQVAIVGGGPAGLLLAHMLDVARVQSTVLERHDRHYVMGRIRAGVLEHGSADALRRAGVGVRMDNEGQVHTGVNLAFAGRQLRIDFKRLADKSVIVYGQTEIQKDLFEARDRMHGVVIENVEDVQLHGVDGDRPFVTYTKDGGKERIDCDFIAGCDGSHGVSRAVIPMEQVRTYERIYPFGWLGVLSETPPVHDELIYANHERGFALCSMRNPELSRYYVQCPLETDIEDWPDERFWEELKRRIPNEAASHLVTGPSIEKSITPLRSFVAEPMRYKRLLLAGDAAHVVPPTGAKGLNLAISDVVLLSQALIDFYQDGSTARLDSYSDVALARVWKAVRFSWWMTTLMHRFPDESDFAMRIRQAEFEYLSTSEAAQTALAENYVGLPLT